MMALTYKQERFVEEFVVDLNGSAAYKRAGFSPGGADQNSSRLMCNDKIRAAIRVKLDEKGQQCDIEATALRLKLQQLIDDKDTPAPVLVRGIELACRLLGLLTDRVEVETVTRRLIVLETTDKGHKLVAAPVSPPLLEGSDGQDKASEGVVEATEGVEGGVEEPVRGMEVEGDEPTSPDQPSEGGSNE